MVQPPRRNIVQDIMAISRIALRLRSIFSRAGFNLSIEPNKGLGRLGFGSSTDQVKDYLGMPDEVDDEFHQGLATGWSYNELSLSVLFHAEDWIPDHLFRLILFTTSNPSVGLWGEKIIGKSESQIVALLKSHG